MTRSFLLALLFAATLAPAGAFAQSQATTQERKACSGDARRLCKHVLGNGDMAVYSCLQTHAEKLRPACRQLVLGY